MDSEGLLLWVSRDYRSSLGMEGEGATPTLCTCPVHLPHAPAPCTCPVHVAVGRAGIPGSFIKPVKGSEGGRGISPIFLEFLSPQL